MGEDKVIWPTPLSIEGFVRSLCTREDVCRYCSAGVITEEASLGGVTGDGIFTEAR